LDRLHEELKDCDIDKHPEKHRQNQKENDGTMDTDEDKMNGPNSVNGKKHDRSSIISRTFQGQLRSEVICDACKHVSSRIDPFFGMAPYLMYKDQLFLIFNVKIFL
jgi:ubiquitin C-terminal hydrolase